MFSHMVHVEREGTAAFDVRVTNTGARGDTARFHQIYRTKLEADLDTLAPDQYHRFETWYASSMADAERLAQKFAQELPNRRIYVLELKAIAQSTSTPAVISNYSEKGLIPK